MPIPPTIPLAELSRAAPEALTERLPAENATLAQATAELRAEAARLKGVKARPAIKPSGMDQGTEPQAADKNRARGAKGRKTERLAIHTERIVKAEVPPGSRFKGGACPRAGHEPRRDSRRQFRLASYAAKSASAKVT